MPGSIARPRSFKDGHRLHCGVSSRAIRGPVGLRVTTSRAGSTPAAYWPRSCPGSLAGATGLQGPTGPQGPPGPPGGSANSLDALIGTPCDQGTPQAGTLNVSYSPQSNGTDSVGLVCTQTNPAFALNVIINDQASQVTCTGFPQVCSGGASGRLTITSSPGSIDCSNNAGTCTDAFQQGTMVTLTATVGPDTASPPNTSVFQGWHGCDSVSGLTCTVTVNSIREVTATVAPAPGD